MSRKGDLHWTEDEEVWLKKNISKMNYKDLSLALKKPYQSITSKVLRLGLKNNLANKRHGKLNCNWKGGKTIDGNGYIKLNQCDRLEHDIVLEKAIGRSLQEQEVVHHIDGEKQNNNLSNLFLCDRSTHRHIHHSLEQAAFSLFSQGIIKFNKKKSKYYVAKEFK